MDKIKIAAIGWYIFFILAFVSILSFTDFAHMKWYDDGIDMIFAIFAIGIASTLYNAYKISKHMDIMLVSVGLFILAYLKIAEIFIQELEVFLNYTQRFVVIWTAIDIFTLLGILMIAKGVWNVTK